MVDVSTLQFVGLLALVHTLISTDMTQCYFFFEVMLIFFACNNACTFTHPQIPTVLVEV